MIHTSGNIFINEHQKWLLSRFFNQARSKRSILQIFLTSHYFNYSRMLVSSSQLDNSPVFIAGYLSGFLDSVSLNTHEFYDVFIDDPRCRPDKDLSRLVIHAISSAQDFIDTQRDSSSFESEHVFKIST